MEDAAGIRAIFKSPVTDDGKKFSHRGIPVPHMDLAGNWRLEQTLNPHALIGSAFIKVFDHGRVQVREEFDIIRKRVDS